MALGLLLGDELRLVHWDESPRLLQVTKSTPWDEYPHEIRQAKNVLRISLLEVARSPDHKDLPSPLRGFLLVKRNKASRHAVSIKKLRGENYHAFDQVRLHEGLANNVLCIGFLVPFVLLLRLLWLTTEEHSLGHHDDCFTSRFERLHHLLKPCIVTV